MEPTTRLTPHFTYLEATHSATAVAKGLDNTPTEEELATIQRTAMKMEIVRMLLDKKAIVIYPNHRWFSTEEVNKAVGGASTSQHRKGEAVDFTCPDFGTPRQICQKIMANTNLIKFDQLILEPSWVHISFNTSHASAKRAPRLQYLDLSRK